MWRAVNSKIRRSQNSYGLSSDLDSFKFIRNKYNLHNSINDFFPRTYKEQMIKRIIEKKLVY